MFNELATTLRQHIQRDAMAETESLIFSTIQINETIPLPSHRPGTVLREP
jgi:hypothetical protein